ncbi:MAG TPA: hypothetical protein VNR41_03220 [Xanthobacteraceae bacterium]|jgi:hypothetical protein|nr:hypothetical protein [Xanthobacteraceae bacterium]
MDLTLWQWGELLVFMGLMLAMSMYALSVSGQFPLTHRTEPFRSALGGLILFGSLLLTFAALAAGIYFVHATVPWYALVIGGGAMVLITPLLLPNFSDKFVDGRSSLLTFSCIAALLSIGLGWLG